MDTEELVTAEALWISMRAGVFGCVPMIVAIFFGLDPSWGMLAVPFIAFISGYGWANFGISIAGFAKSFENFNYVVSAVLTPLFLVAGTFFPIDTLPQWAQVLANFNPLYQCVQLVRAAVFETWEWVDLASRRDAPRLRPRHVARRHPRDDGQARRLAGRSSTRRPSCSRSTGRGRPAR